MGDLLEKLIEKNILKLDSRECIILQHPELINRVSICWFYEKDWPVKLSISKIDIDEEGLKCDLTKYNYLLLNSFEDLKDLQIKFKIEIDSVCQRICLIRQEDSGFQDFAIIDNQ